MSVTHSNIPEPEEPMYYYTIEPPAPFTQQKEYTNQLRTRDPALVTEEEIKYYVDVLKDRYNQYSKMRADLVYLAWAAHHHHNVTFYYDDEQTYYIGPTDATRRSRTIQQTGWIMKHVSKGVPAKAIKDMINKHTHKGKN